MTRIPKHAQSLLMFIDWEKAVHKAVFRDIGIPPRKHSGRCGAKAFAHGS